jgi:hypothetical protein
MADPDLSQFLSAPSAPAAGPDLSSFITAKPKDASPDLAAFMGPSPEKTPSSPAPGPTATPAKPDVRWDKPKNMVDEFAGDLKDVARERSSALKHDFTTKPGHGLPLRIAKTAADVAAYPFGPLDAAARATVGRAAGDVAGMVDQVMGKGTTPQRRDAVKRNIGDVSTMTIPLNSGAKATGAAGKVAEAGDTAKKIFSPATVNDEARAAANLHRQILGKRGIEADKAAYDLGKHQRVVGNAPPEDQLKIIRYVENRSKGGVPLDPKYKPAADAIKSVADRYRKQIEYVMGKDGPNFVTDYYARMWKQKPADVERAIARQGSGRNLKARSLPTYEDGLKAGLTPVYPNPLDAMTAYSENMGRFLATHEILDGMEKAPQIGARWFAPGKQPEGWVALSGVKTRTPERLIVKSGEGLIGKQPEKALFAPEGAARVYNNFISKGLDKGDAGPIYRGARAASNAMVQLKLGLSAFHASVMGQEGIVSEMARGLKQVSRGDVKGLATMAKAPAAPVTTYARGAKMLDQITGKAAPAAFDGKLNSLYERTGQRLGMDKIYATRKGTSLFSSALRGTFQRDLQQALQTTYKGKVGDRVKGVLDLTGNVIQSTAAPLFEHYIPNLKRGAWAKQMEDFLKANPGATEAEQTAYGQKLADSIDNRFGELVVDNNFWNRSAYQIGQLLMLSPSWNIGTAREIGGGVINIPKSLKGVVEGKGIDDKTAYVAALVGTTMLQNGAATYLHTGQMPEGADWFAYRTGGTDPATGKPERAMLPGYMKDVLAWGLQGPGKEALNKLNPGLKSLTELLSNKDFKDQPIRDVNAPADKQAGQVAEYAVEQGSPIAFGESSKPKKGSKLSGLERFMAVRPAPRYLTDPKGVKAAQERRARRDWRAKTRTDQRAKARQAEP